ncbi:MAG: hypothetical protein Q9172_000274 [Xanthocarpia lactea]
MAKKQERPVAKRQKMDNDDDSNQSGVDANNQSSLMDKPQTPLVPILEYTTLVKIIVGPDNKTFYAYKELLCKKSAFFKAACEGAFKESNGTINLPEQDPTVVNYFIHWSCSGQLRGLYWSPEPTTTLTSLKKAAAKEREAAAQLLQYNPMNKVVSTEKRTELDLANYRDLPLQQLISLYIFADFAQVKGLKDAIVDAIIEGYGDPEPPGTTKAICIWNLKTDRPDWLVDPIKLINSAWEHLPAEAPLRRVLTNLFCDAVTQASGTRSVAILSKHCPILSHISFPICTFVIFASRYSRSVILKKVNYGRNLTIIRVKVRHTKPKQKTRAHHRSRVYKGYIAPVDGIPSKDVPIDSQAKRPYRVQMTDISDQEGKEQNAPDMDIGSRS